VRAISVGYVCVRGSDEWSPLLLFWTSLASDNRMSDHIGRIDRIPLITTVMERIQRLIEEPDVGVGERIPSDRQLREGFGVGRSTVREALRALEALGAVEVVQGRGAFVHQRHVAGDRVVRSSVDNVGGDWLQLGAVARSGSRRRPRSLPRFTVRTPSSAA
jgi:DNA-binding transcriptional regulator YhcF (GntR family)